VARAKHRISAILNSNAEENGFSHAELFLATSRSILRDWSIEVDHFKSPSMVTKELSAEQVGEAQRRLNDCLNYLDSIGVFEIASHVSLAADRFSESYAKRPPGPYPTPASSGACRNR
jgi:hypothetical protein